MPEEDRDTQELPKVGKHRARDAWGPKEIIALIIILASFFLAGLALVTDRQGDTVPVWIATLIGGVTLYLYKNGKER